jgi:hypothetical protein
MGFSSRSSHEHLVLLPNIPLQVGQKDFSKYSFGDMGG